MFDKILFDQNSYDRSIDTEGIYISLSAVSNITIIPRFITPLYMDPITGFTEVSPGVNNIIFLEMHCFANSDFNFHEIIFSIILGGNLYGSSVSSFNLIIITPLSLSISASSIMSIVREYIHQYISSYINATSLINIIINAKTKIDILQINGMGSIKLTPLIKISTSIILAGSSILTLRRIGALNEEIFELNPTSILPGGEVIIDTDIMTVLIDNIENVSSVTTDSEFFELIPGDSLFTIETDTEQELGVTIIWQNRWL